MGSFSSLLRVGQLSVMDRFPIVRFSSQRVPARLLETVDGVPVDELLGIEVDPNLDRVMDPLDRPSAVISFIGPTQSGKTFLLNKLTEAQADLGVAEEDQMTPTTGDVVYCCYSNSPDCFLHCLDVEGDGGSEQVLPEEIQPFQEQLVEDVFDEFSETNLRRYNAMRIPSVRQHLPRMANAVSDVIVYVNTEPLARSHYCKFVREFVPLATEGLSSVPPPVLIIVQNQHRKRESYDVEKTTTDFLQVHDKDRSLDNFFSRVIVLRVADCDSPNFEQSLNQFLQIVWDSIREAKALREANGFALTTAQWVPVFRQVIEQFHTEVLRVGSIITCNVLKSIGNSMIEQTGTFYEMFDCDSPHQWHQARTHSIQFMVTCFVKKAAKLEIAQYQSQKELLRTKLHQAVDQFIEVTDRDKRCTSSISLNGKTYWCSHTKATHDKKHYQPTILSYSGRSFVRSLKKMLGQRFDNVWPGEFEENSTIYTQTSASLHQLAEQTLEAFETGRATPEDIAMARRCIIRNSMTDKTRTDITERRAQFGQVGVSVCRVCFRLRVNPFAPAMRCHAVCDSCVECLTTNYLDSCVLCNKQGGHPHCPLPHASGLAALF